MPREENAADVELSAYLASIGLDALPRRLERMRQAGLLSESARVGLGRGLGSRSVRADDERERAAYMVRLRDECTTFEEAVLVAFVRGDYPIAKDRLDAAYAAEFGRLGQWIRKRAGHAERPVEGVVPAGSAVARYLEKEKAYRWLRARARESGLTNRSGTVARAMLDLGTGIVGVALGTGGHQLTAAADDFAALIGDVMVGADPVLADIGAVSDTLIEAAPEMSAGRVIEHAKHARLSDLERTRDSMKVFRRFAKALGRFTAHAHGPRTAFAWLMIGGAEDRQIAYVVPPVNAVFNRLGRTLGDALPDIESDTRLFEAASDLLDELPLELRRIAKPGVFVTLGSSQRDELRQRLLAISIAHPAVMETVLSRAQPAAE